MSRYSKQPFRTTKAGKWYRENSNKQRFEKSNPQIYDSPDSEAYRKNFDGIDWGDHGKD